MLVASLNSGTHFEPQYTTISVLGPATWRFRRTTGLILGMIRVTLWVIGVINLLTKSP